MKKKGSNIIYSILFGTLLIILGFIFINYGFTSIKFITFLLGITFIFLGLSYVFKLLKNKLKNSNEKILNIRPLISIFLGVVVLMFPDIPISMIGVLTGIYCLVCALIRIINFINKVKDNLKGKLKDLILIPFFLGFAVFFMFSPYMHIDVLMWAVGFYFILFGIGHYKDALYDAIPEIQKNKLKRKIRIMLPSFVSAFIPRIVLEEVNEYLKPSDKDNHAIPKYEKIKSDEEPDLEVLIHVTENGYGSMGHMDLIIDGKVFSYGNYDSYSARLFEAIGDGVLFIADVKKYIPFVIKDSKKTLFAYGLKFDEEKLNRIKNKIEDIMSNSYEWNPGEYTGNEKPPYAFRLKNSVDVKFFKFKEGKYKTYFVMGNNCVKIADEIIGSAGTDMLEMNGIITPGVYYDYLDKEFNKNSSFVISKKIYN